MRFTFLKENGNDVVKLYINQIGVAIFSMFLYTAAGAISESDKASLTIKIIISAFAMLFYYVLIYNVAWEIGAKDKIRIDSNRLERTPAKGIKLGLWANSLNFIVVGTALLLYIVYVLSGAEVFMSIFAVLNLIFRLFVSMYLGVIQGICAAFADNENLNWIMQTSLYLVFPVISAIITHISYILGLKDKRFFPNAKYKSNN